MLRQRPQAMQMTRSSPRQEPSRVISAGTDRTSNLEPDKEALLNASASYFSPTWRWPGPRWDVAAAAALDDRSQRMPVGLGLPARRRLDFGQECW